ncbi:MAG: hypothetical protein NDF55_00360 [archaeon GB-1867-005]|nr:hypothetical protein [Candidatus Culexmicrobium cathedralense]
MSKALIKLQEIDPRILYLLMFIVVSVPLLKPIRLPISISPETKTLYDFIEERISPGSVVVMDSDMNPSTAAECLPQFIAVTRHLAEKGARIIFIASRVEGVQFIEITMKEVFGGTKDHPDYGKKFVNLGYRPGGSVGLRSFTEDVYYMKTDVYGNDLTKLPIMEGVKTAADFALYAVATGSSVDGYVMLITDPYGTPIAGLVTAVLSSRVYAYWPEKVIGFLNGLRGGAEYELLIGRPGSAVKAMDAQSLGHMLIIIFVILGNIGYFFAQRRSEK